MNIENLTIVAQNYENPLPEGLTQASKALIDSLLLGGFEPEIFSLGWPHKKHISPQDIYKHSFGNKTIVFDPIRYHKMFNVYGVDPVFWNIYHFLNALIVAKLSSRALFYLLNVPIKVFSVPIKIKAPRARTITHLFHSIRLGAPIHHKFADYVFCVNRESYHYYHKVVQDRAYYVPYPVDTTRFMRHDKKKARESLGLPIDATIIGYVGRAQSERGIFDLVHAFSKLSKAQDDLILVSVSPPSESSNLDTAVEQNSAVVTASRGKNIQMITDVIPMDLYYSAIDIIALPYRKAHLSMDPPVAVVEAMASGAPLVTTPVGAIREVVGAGNALMVQPGNVFSLKSALETLVQNPEQRLSMGNNAREHVVENLSYAVIGKKIRRIIEEEIE